MRVGRHFTLLKKTCLFLIFLLASQSVQAGFFAGDTKFYTVKTPHFYIHYPDSLAGVATEFTTVVETVHERLTDRIQWNPKRRTHVVLTDKSDAPNGLASVIPENYILLYTAIPDADSNLDHYRDYYEFLFTHEYTHILHIDQNHKFAVPLRKIFGQIVAPNGATPGWMREGMAVYEESLLDLSFGRANSDYTNMYLRTAYLENLFPRIDQIAGLSRQFPGGMGAYLYGGDFMQWLAKTYGEDRMYQYQKKYASGFWLYSLNNKAKRVYGKSFYKLWDEYRKANEQKFEDDKNQILLRGLTDLATVLDNTNTQEAYTPNYKTGGYAYYESGLDDDPAIYIYEPGQKEPHQIKRRLQGQMSFSRTGRYLAFSSLASVEKKTSRSEVFYYDLKDKKLYRVFDRNMPNVSMRVSDPDFGPQDGGQRWMVMVRSNAHTDQLYVFDAYEKKGYVLTDEPAKTQLSNPRFSPDGRHIVVSRKDAKTGFRDIVLYSSSGRRLMNLTRDAKPDLHPVFSPNGSSVYFSSYRTGVANIFAYHLKQHTLRQLSNVFSGVFQPMPAKDGRTIYVKHYGSKKSSVKKFDYKPYNHRLFFAELRPSPDSNKNNLARNQSEDAADSTLDRGLNLPGESSTDSTWYDVPPDGETFSDTTAETTTLFGNQATASFEEIQPGFDFSLTDLPGVNSRFFSSHQTDEETELTTKKVDAQTQKVAQESKTYPSRYKNLLKHFPSELKGTGDHPQGAKSYSAFPRLLIPSYVVPNVLVQQSSVLATLTIGKFDPLYRHFWTAFANYWSDAAFVGGGGTYVYSRFDPVFYAGAIRFAVDWGTINNTRFFEDRFQVYAGTSYAWKHHGVNARYFYEGRSAFTNLPGINLVNMQPYAGVTLQYTYRDYEQYANSVSREDGVAARFGVDVTDQMLGADAVNEEIVSYGDIRTYYELPWFDHHVLALRVSGGWVWGDVQQFGVFRMGGPFGEGTGAAPLSPRIFPLRGLAGISFGGDRAFMFSAEYRMPLIQDVNRGIGTWPVFMDKLHLDFFVDGGDIKFRTEVPDLFTRMLIAPGAELKGDFVLGYGLPVTARLGYGVILTNRARLGNLSDSLTGMAVKNGTAYLQVGTSF